MGCVYFITRSSMLKRRIHQMRHNKCALKKYYKHYSATLRPLSFTCAPRLYLLLFHSASHMSLPVRRVVVTTPAPSSNKRLSPLFPRTTPIVLILWVVSTEFSRGTTYLRYWGREAVLSLLRDPAADMKTITSPISLHCLSLPTTIPCL
ncbi:hypothetical protein BDZ91DRAFT_531429 [Kalaharituber pfeilii]|nr:hypothetical protein BDZ91DRAFT_531429 [Kalaharituber pfeilii]